MKKGYYFALSLSLVLGSTQETQAVNWWDNITTSVNLETIMTQTGNVHLPVPKSTIENVMYSSDYYNSGTYKNDLLIGNKNRNVIYSDKDNWNYTNIDSGNDVVLGAGGNDYLETGRTTGTSYVDGGEGNDRIYGTWTNSNAGGEGDILIGGDGDDFIDSGAGDDIVYGGKGDDSLYNAAENGVRDSDNVYIYEGNYAEYTISTSGGYTYVLDSIEDRDGNDRIANGHREGTFSSKGDMLQFADGRVDIKTLQFIGGATTHGVTYGSDESDDSNLTNDPENRYLSTYNLSPTASSTNTDNLLQAIEDTAMGGTLHIDISGEYAINQAIFIDKPIHIVVENQDFTLKLVENAGEVIFVKSEGVVLDGVNINANQKARIGIESDYGNLTVQNSKIYNMYYGDTSVSQVSAGIVVVPQQGDGTTITIVNNEIYGIVNTLHDQKEGGYGMARGIFIAYPHTTGANVNIEGNYIHNIDSEEDDFIYIEQLNKNILSNKNFAYLTVIKNNRFIGFTRRALKIRVPNALIEGNIIESKNVEDQKNYPAYSGISIFGSGNTIKNNTITLTKYFAKAIDLDTDGSVNIYNTKIENNTITMAGGVTQQFPILMQYRSFDYLVQNNTIKMISPYYVDYNGDKSSHFFYLKAYTTGEIKNNTFIVENGTATAVVHNNLYLSNTATNKTKLTNNVLVGNINYYVQYQGLNLSASTPTTQTQGYIVDVEYTGNKTERQAPIVVITPIE